METVTTPIIADGVLAELAEKASACRYSVLRRYVGLPRAGARCRTHRRRPRRVERGGAPDCQIEPHKRPTGRCEITSLEDDPCELLRFGVVRKNAETLDKSQRRSRRRPPQALAALFQEPHARRAVPLDRDSSPTRG